VGPRAPSTAANLLLLDVAAGRGVAGGGPALIEALVASATAAGVQIRTGEAVEQIVVGDAGVEGVRLAGGEVLAAGTVAASCDPRHALLDLLPPGLLARRFERHLRDWRCRGTTAHVLLALSRWPMLDGTGGARVEFATLVRGVDDLERAADVVKYGAFPEHPALELQLAPGQAPGSCVASALVHFAPYDLRPAWDAASRERLGDRVVALLSGHAPDLESSILAREVLVPPDIERRHGVSGGHLHHGEHSADQLLVRPAPGCAGGRTPIPGLFLCGSGSAPGGGLTCAPGARAARTIAREALRR
jgi:phytoene dehydrogenase-like protein